MSRIVSSLLDLPGKVQSDKLSDSTKQDGFAHICSRCGLVMMMDKVKYGCTFRYDQQKFEDCCVFAELGSPIICSLVVNDDRSQKV